MRYDARNMATPRRSTRRRDATAAKVRALAHPLRLRVIRALYDGPRSNQELAVALHEDPATVLYHVRTLVKTGFLAPAGSRRGRAARPRSCTARRESRGGSTSTPACPRPTPSREPRSTRSRPRDTRRGPGRDAQDLTAGPRARPGASERNCCDASTTSSTSSRCTTIPAANRSPCFSRCTGARDAGYGVYSTVVAAVASVANSTADTARVIANTSLRLSTTA